jgi:hypothetical protein
VEKAAEKSAPHALFVTAGLRIDGIICGAAILLPEQASMKPKLTLES